jgi:hypothetical protein
MTCPPVPQSPSVFTSLFPTSPSQWGELFFSGCVVVFVIFIGWFRLARFLRPEPAGPQRWILLTMVLVAKSKKSTWTSSISVEAMNCDAD